VLEAFIDESGTHKGAPSLSVAGWVAHHGYWKRFLSRWGEKRQFHAKDPRYDSSRAALYDAILDSQLEGFVSWIKPEHYKKHADPLFKSAIGNAYAVCTFNVALGIFKFARTNRMGKVAFIIESGQSNVEFIRQVLEGMKAKERFGVASVAVASKEDFVQLCTADFLAYSRTSDQGWFEEFVASGLVAEDYVTPERLVRMSDDLLRRYKILKRTKQLLQAEKRRVVYSANDANAKGKASE
jgi:hypothetical protein